jgi:hypothetical protein
MCFSGISPKRSQPSRLIELRFFLFISEYVYKVPPNYDINCFKTEFVQLLVDEDTGAGIPKDLISSKIRHTIIYAMSPYKE